MGIIQKINNKLSFKRRMTIEVLETLATICLYLRYENPRNGYTRFMESHFNELKQFSYILREKDRKNDIL